MSFGSSKESLIQDQKYSHQFSGLSKYPLGSFKELVSLSAPLIFILFSGSMMCFCDRLFLAHHSLKSLEGCIDGSALFQLFQIFLIFLTSIAQIFVGKAYGSQQYQKIGTYIWQMIWVSFFSMLFIFPIGKLAEYFFFKEIAKDIPGPIYFRCLLNFSFLFPLGGALSSFYTGRGQLRIICWASVSALLLNILLDPLFIFGIGGICPPMGVFGAALATALSQGLFCLILFIDFLSPKNRLLFGTSSFKMDKKVMWESLRIGFPRCIARIVIVAIWVSNAHYMTVMGGDHLLVLSIGNSLSLLFLFINDGMSQGMITIASYALGKKSLDKIGRLIRSALLFLTLSALLVAIPCFFCPRSFVSYFFTTPLPPRQMNILIHSCMGLWLFFVGHGFGALFFSLLTAKGDTLFIMLYNIFFGWMIQYLPVRLLMDIWQWQADTYFTILALGSFASILIYFIRFQMIKKHFTSVVNY